jgi:hypothetical protein
MTGLYTAEQKNSAKNWRLERKNDSTYITTEIC